MNLALLILGLLLVILAFVDALWTTVWVDGASGPIAGFLEHWIWQLMQLLIPRKRNSLLSLSGPIIQAVVLFTWVLMLWAGWVIVLSSYDESLIYSRDNLPTELTGRIYFVAYTMSTMGNGDYYPHRGMWELLASFTTLSGMLLITLVVSFVLSVLGGVIQKRSLASPSKLIWKPSPPLPSIPLDAYPHLQIFPNCEKQDFPLSVMKNLTNL